MAKQWANNGISHLMALTTSIIWGTTFVSTKVLIQQGISPESILFYRFIIAYTAIWFICPRKLFSNSIKDELLFLAAGLCGGSLYFVAENRALGMTLASNVSLIVCTTTIFTGILSHLLIKGERMRKQLVYGAIFALTGVGLVVFNGHFILKLNSSGDILTLFVALMWAFYCILLKKLDSNYTTTFITRKIFFYGIITLLPVFSVAPLTTDLKLLTQPEIFGNILFLGLVASLLCYIMWNKAVKQLGTIRTSNYIYIIPLVTLITSAIAIDEPITSFALIGALLIIGGVYISEQGFKLPKLEAVNK